jgi:hypothetical protein
MNEINNTLDELIISIIQTPQPKPELYGLLMQNIARLCNISQYQYVILGSYPMRMYREINDLDVDMVDTEWNKLSKLKSKYIILSEHPQSKEQIWTLNMTDLFTEKK